MRAIEWMEATIVDEQMHVTHSEWRCVLVIGIGIFPWMEEKEEAKEQHIGDGGCFGGICATTEVRCLG
jgi:hypothetical protein